MHHDRTPADTADAPKPTPPATANRGDEQGRVDLENLRLPDDHRLVTAYRRTQDELRALKAEKQEREDAKKSDVERLTAERDGARADAESAQRDVPAKVARELRGYLVDFLKIDKEDADLFLTAEDPALLVKQAKKLGARTSGPVLNYVPRQGTGTVAGASVSAAERGRQAALERYAKQNNTTPTV